MRNIDLAAELGAKVYVCWGGREGAESGAAKDIAAALDRYREAFNILGEYVADQGYDLRFAIEPKPNEPRGDILLPTIGHALAFIETLDRSETGRREPRDRARGDGRHERGRTATPRRSGRASSSTSTSTASTDPKFDQDLRFGAGNVRGAFWVVDTLLSGGYDGPVHFDFKPARTEDEDGVWSSAKACMTQLPDPAGEGARLPGRPRGPGRRWPTPAWPSSPSRPWPTARPGRTWPPAAARRREDRRPGLRVRASRPARPRAPLRRPRLSR